MMISRTPFRISFVGGGSDINSFYNRHRGCVLNAAINKYIYLSIHPFFNKSKIQLKYSVTETVDSVTEIKHNAFRECLKLLSIDGGVEITSTADVPAGTGLGSSSSFIVGLLNLLYAYTGKFVSKETLADLACKIEIDMLQEPIGKQDQYAASYGGFNFIEFFQDERVSINPIIMRRNKLDELQSNLIMFYTGVERSSRNILKVQKQEMMTNADKYETMVKMTKLTRELKDELLNNNISSFGKILNKAWCLKKKMSSDISCSKFDDYYARALENGAEGGKILGAGGGGFFLFYCEKKRQDLLKHALDELTALPFKFDHEGSKIIYVGDTY